MQRILWVLRRMIIEEAALDSGQSAHRTHQSHSWLGHGLDCAKRDPFYRKPFPDPPSVGARGILVFLTSLFPSL